MDRRQIEEAISNWGYHCEQDIAPLIIQQVNAALEEAANRCDDGDTPNDIVARIRALKIK